MSHSLAFFLWLALHAAGALPAERYVLVFRDGSVEAAARPPAAEVRSRLRHAWVWSPAAAPRQVPVDRLGERPSPDRRRLRVTVAGAREGRGLAVVAAPLAMWAEVPEGLLPSWPVGAGGEVRLPVAGAERWRLRLVGERQGSWWTEVPAGAGAVTLAASAAPDLELLVTGADGRPLADATLDALAATAGRRDGGGLLARARGTDGRLRLPALPAAAELVLVVFEPAHAPAVLRGRPGTFPSTVRLGRGAAVTGRFTDPDGRPLAGVRVTAEAWLSAGVPRLLHRRSESGDDGAFAVRGLPDGEVAVLARAPGAAPFAARVEPEDGTADLGTIVLAPGRRLEVLVVDDLGAPVPGARVRAGRGLAATADGRGLALLDGLAAGRALELEAEAPGHLPARSRLEPPAPARTRLALRRAFAVTGRLLAPGGRPAEGGSVRVRTGATMRDEALSAEARFELDLEPGVEAELDLVSPATRELTVRVAAGAAGERRDLGDLAAPAGLTVTGRIVDARDGAPVPGATVWAPRPASGGPLLAWVDGDLLEARSGADGGFRLAGLAPQPAALRVEAPGYARAHLPLSPPADDLAIDVLEVGEVPLSAGAEVTVTLDEAPHEPATARVDLAGQWLELDMLSAPVHDGAAVVRHVPAGPAVVSVVAGRALLCEAEVTVPDGGSVEVPCDARRAEVHGLVTVGGERAGAGLLTWLPPAIEAPGTITTIRSGGGLRQQHVFGGGRPQVDVPVEPDGTFATDRLTAGRWRVLWQPEGGSLSEPLDVEVPRTERYQVALDYPGAVVRGLVTDREGRPAAGARVRALGRSALAIAGAGGRFTLAGLEPGRHRLEARLDEAVSRPVEVEVAPGPEPEPVVLVLGPDDPVRLHVAVLDAAGSPVPGALVFLEEEGRAPRLLTAGADGRAVAPIEEPHPARLRAAALAGGRWALGAWTGWERAAEGLTLAVAPSGSLAIESSRAGVPRVLSEQGWDVSWLLTRVGARPEVAPGLPLVLDGLPAGRYTIALDGVERRVAVPAGGRVAVELDD